MKAHKALADARRMQDDRRNQKADRKIIEALTLDLFAIVRHVAPRRSAAGLDGVSDKRIHHEAVKPIRQAFAKVGGEAVPRRTARDEDVQAAPDVRLHRMLAAERLQSEINADIWRDGRQAETSEDILWRARTRLFAWDTRFEPALFQSR